MDIPNKEHFQPSNQTWTKWLSTRKSDIYVGRVPMPRLFSDTGNSTDRGWFIIALIGEFLGLAVTVYGGIRSGGIFLILATLSIIMFIFCDFFFAVKLHRNEGKKCKIRSLKLLTDVPNDLERFDIELREGKFADFLYQTGIILIAIIKVIGIILLGVFNNLILYIPFAIIYFIVSYVHLNHTGFYFAYTSTENAINKEHKKFAYGNFKAQEIQELVSTKLPLTGFPIKYTPHEIIEKDKEKMEYAIITKGILTDDDIVHLIAGQVDENKISLFKTCRSFQIANFL